MCNVQGYPKNVNILWYYLPTCFVDLAMRRLPLEQQSHAITGRHPGFTFLHCYKVSLIALEILLIKKKPQKQNSTQVLTF